MRSERQSAEEILNAWLQLEDPVAQRVWLAGQNELFDDALVASLKEEANRLLRIDIKRSQALADVLQLAGDLFAKPEYTALGLRAHADANAIGLGAFQQALEHYQQAAAIYHLQGNQIEQVRTEASMVWSLASLGRASEALAIGEQARVQLRAYQQWRPLATLTMNMASIHGRLGNDASTLDLLNAAHTIWLELGVAGAGPLARIEQNRSIVYRNLGQFERSTAASHAAFAGLTQLGQHVEAARAQQNLAVTYFTLGRYNEALQLLDLVRAVFHGDGRERDTLLADIFISDCLLQLRRFSAAIEICERAQQLFHSQHIGFEAGQALLNQAIANIGLGRFPIALEALSQARMRFEQEHMPLWVASADLEIAAVYMQQEQYTAALQLAETCTVLFAERQQPLKQLRAMVLVAQAHTALGEAQQAAYVAEQVADSAEQLQVPTLIYQAQYLLGQLQVTQHPAIACEHYDRAINAIEQLRSQIMVEFRADYIADKQAVYEDVAAIWLQANQPEQALNYVERAKSRVLRELLAQRIDLGIQAQSPADLVITSALNQLQAERNRLLRRWESRAITREEPDMPEAERLAAHQELLALEQQITNQWHRLLIQNANYAQQSLWQPVPSINQAALPRPLPGEVVLEFFTLHEKLIVFLVDATQIRVVQLTATVNEIQRATRFFWLNLKAVIGSSSERIIALAGQARQLLGQLYQALIAPYAALLQEYTHLRFVPHGVLHYLPLHALYDGASFVLEQYACSYLPSLHGLNTAQPRTNTTQNALVVGYSQSGRLPLVCTEAQTIAEVLKGDCVLEAEATLAHIRPLLADRPIIHLATHGEFRADNPLFSGLALADGYLTTLDVFQLRLQASLVTLSACQTGRSVVGGGDELLGLMRGFLYAGAASLILSLWPVEDQATQHVMTTLYRHLAAGQTKAAALRAAQLASIGERDSATAHPFFWAAHLLVGETGTI